jgi:hypothetical protein
MARVLDAYDFSTKAFAFATEFAANSSLQVFFNKRTRYLNKI